MYYVLTSSLNEQYYAEYINPTVTFSTNPLIDTFESQSQVPHLGQGDFVPYNSSPDVPQETNATQAHHASHLYYVQQDLLGLQDTIRPQDSCISKIPKMYNKILIPLKNLLAPNKFLKSSKILTPHKFQKFFKACASHKILMHF